jgi:purine-nucleoside/S-methyl-5'-thioadenosine phosphorylase / adenosine deaminase
LDFEIQQHVYRAPALAQFGWLEHGFGDRFYQPSPTLTTLRQIHSDIAIHVDRPGCAGEGDALVSGAPGQVVGVKTADCVPILLVDSRLRVVAAVHAGWRGAVSRIVQKTVQAMVVRWNTRPQDLYAAIGPGIGRCCYEVGPEVAIQFGDDSGRPTRIDLEDANRRQLLAAGIGAGRIYSAGLCTFCHPGEFHSFRRDGESAGRMISFIGIAGPPSRYETSVETDRSS